jgi:hypothetical protein
MFACIDSRFEVNRSEGWLGSDDDHVDIGRYNFL